MGDVWLIFSYVTYDSRLVVGILDTLLLCLGVPYLQVDRGQVTFDSEGNDNPNSIYFSRKPHVPSSASGITIGRGYDLKLRKQSEVYNDLTNSGMSSSIALKFSHGIGLKGDRAKNYLKVSI